MLADNLTGRSMTERRRIYLIRHAAVAYFDADGQPVNPATVRLTSVGKAQAYALNALLAEVPVDRAVCSEILRTRETIEQILGREHELQIESMAEFNEIRGGRLREIPSDRLFVELANPYIEATKEEGYFLRGERFDDFERRVLSGFVQLLDDTSWRNLLIVAHDAVNRIVLGWALGTNRRTMVGLEQDYGCLNIIDVPIGRGDSGAIQPLIRAINLTPYDPIKQHIHLTSMEEVFQSYTSSRN